MSIEIPWKTNFGRSYKITIGVREYIKANYISPEVIFAKWYDIPEDPGDTIPSDAVSISNLTDKRGFSFTFDTKQVASSKGASSEDSLLVLNNVSTEIVRLLQSPNCICIVECGYEGKVVKAYTGDVVNMFTTNNPPDIEYNIRLSAMGNVARNTMINTHYNEAMAKADIILDMAKRFPSTSLSSYGLDKYKDKYKTGGTGATGSLVAVFDEYMKKHNLEYSFSNNKICIIPFRLLGKDYDDFARINYTLPLPSIKNIPPQIDHTKKGSTDTQSKVRKLSINTYYLPVDIGQFITIPTSEYTKEFAGTYIVKGRRINLQSKGNAWDVVLIVEELTQ